MSNFYNQGANISLKSNQNYKKDQMMPNQLGYGQLGYNSSQKGYGYSNQASSQVKTQRSKNSYDKSTKVIFQNVAIVSKKAKKVLDVCQDKQTKGMLIIYQDYKQPNQRFDIVQNGDSVNIINKQNGKYLTIAATSQSNGAPIFEQPSAGLISQKFRLAHIQKNEYFIHTFCGKVLDCCQQRTDNGTRVIQFRCERTQHQRWLIN